MDKYASKQGILEQVNVQIQAFNNEELEQKFIIVNGMKAKFGKDGNQFYFISGSLPDPDCIVGFGITPEKALNNYYKMWKNGN